LTPVGLGAHLVGPRQQVQVQPVALQRDRPSELGGEERGGTGHLWRMARRGRRVNAVQRNVRRRHEFLGSYGAAPYSNPASAKLSPSAGPRTPAGGGSVSVPTRRPSSSAAATRAALVRPIPGTLASSAEGRPARRRKEPSTRANTSPATASASRPVQPVPRRMASSSCPVSAAGPTAQKRSRGRSCWGCSERRKGIGEGSRDGVASAYLGNAGDSRLLQA